MLKRRRKSTLDSWAKENLDTCNYVLIPATWEIVLILDEKVETRVETDDSAEFALRRCVSSRAFICNPKRRLKLSGRLYED